MSIIDAIENELDGSLPLQDASTFHSVLELEEFDPHLPQLLAAEGIAAFLKQPKRPKVFTPRGQVIYLSLHGYVTTKAEIEKAQRFGARSARDFADQLSSETQDELLDAIEELEMLNEATDSVKRTLGYGFPHPEEDGWVGALVVYKQPRQIIPPNKAPENNMQYIQEFMDRGGRFMVYNPDPEMALTLSTAFDINHEILKNHE